MTPGPEEFAGLDISVLRTRRSTALRSLEVSRLRPPQDREAERVAALEQLVARLTEELITRYRDDLALVDILLDPTYPADAMGGGTR